MKDESDRPDGLDSSFRLHPSSFPKAGFPRRGRRCSRSVWACGSSPGALTGNAPAGSRPDRPDFSRRCALVLGSLVLGSLGTDPARPVLSQGLKDVRTQGPKVDLLVSDDHRHSPPPSGVGADRIDARICATTGSSSSSKSLGSSCCPELLEHLLSLLVLRGRLAGELLVALQPLNRAEAASAHVAEFPRERLKPGLADLPHVLHAVLPDGGFPALAACLRLAELSSVVSSPWCGLLGCGRRGPTGDGRAVPACRAGLVVRWRPWVISREAWRGLRPNRGYRLPP